MTDGFANLGGEACGNGAMTAWTPNASIMQREIAAVRARRRIGTAGRSQAARKVVEPDVV
jgi:hypothetical protein